MKDEKEGMGDRGSRLRAILSPLAVSRGRDEWKRRTSACTSFILQLSPFILRPSPFPSGGLTTGPASGMILEGSERPVLASRGEELLG